jgi:hypothetical protein
MQLALARSSWKEYTVEGGKKYYYNEQMKETVWTLPEEFDEVLRQMQTQPARPAAP